MPFFCVFKTETDFPSKQKRHLQANMHRPLDTNKYAIIIYNLQLEQNTTFI